MLNKEVKTRINNLRDILVGNLPLPSDQIELITIGLIYKFMDDQDKESTSSEWGGEAAFFKEELADYTWTAIMSDSIGAAERVTLFEEGIKKIAEAEHIPDFFRSVFQNTFLKFRDGRVFKMFVDGIDEFEYTHSEELGNAFEYLLSSMGAQGKNGQFRTPRNIIEFITQVVAPTKDDTILDPACGTGGFLISAHKYIQAQNKGKLSASELEQLYKNIVGYDNTPLMVRLSKVNMYLHKFKDPQIYNYDTLSLATRWNDKFSCILANPPFMTPKGGVEPHENFRITAKKAEILFSDYILEHLTPDGKAGVIVPEGIIFQGNGDYVELREWAIYSGGLYAVASLPAGVFNPYSGVKTSILFIDRTLARRTDKVLLVKIENDGYSLNTNRDEIKSNDLPEAKRLLQAFQAAPEAFEAGEGEDYDIAYNVVPKSKFAELDDYKATSTAWKFLEGALRRCQAAIQKYEEAKGKARFEANKEKLLEKLRKALDTFTKESNFAVTFEEETATILPTKVDFKAWFQEHLKAATLAYGKSPNAEEKESLPKKLRDYLDGKREYNLAFDTYLENISVSSNYDYVRIGDLVEINSLKVHPAKDYGEQEFIYLDISNVEKGTGKYHIDNRIKGIDAPSRARLKVSDGDIAISTVRPNLKAFALMKNPPLNTVASTGFAIIKCKEQLISNKFLYQLFFSDDLQKQMFRKMGKGSYPSINKNDIKEFTIPLPPLSEQNRIVTEIEQYQKVIDGCNLILQHYQPTFEIDEAWEQMPIGDLFKTVSGTTPKRSNKAYHENGTIHWVKTKDLNNGHLFETEEKITQLALKETSCRVLPIGTVLIAMYGGFNQIGRTGVLQVEAATNQAITALYPTDKMLPDFTNYTLIQLRDRWKRVANSTRKDPNITRSDILEFLLPVPSLEVQKCIVQALQSEQQTITATQVLKEKMEARIKAIIDKVWGVAAVPVED